MLAIFLFVQDARTPNSIGTVRVRKPLDILSPWDISKASGGKEVNLFRRSGKS
ncbi:hypothetical protein J0895_14770 [Phormidium pseudopriestleyi FRX01]|uniref:Uncharacterized protein n=1 Tax=Phormidium pseudopriestleyi FRX01 TaxID=1759528 RepID=A0ABS3FTA3_9CYAN|nr:hypothetical protein [Phormidium pseudopriestleyi]MBO0350346.1 hypothetical protein [Phormidium pseudopriestleyi FRX01]